MDAVLPGCYARVAEGHKPPRISDRRSIARKHVTLVRIDVHDGKHLVYTSHPGSRFVMWWARADGGGQPQQIFESADNVFPRSFSPDGRRLAFHQVSAGTGSDLWTMPLDLGDPDKPRPGTPEVFLRTPRVESSPAFSPDGHWMAYDSDDKGQPDVYVRPFPGPGGQWLISLGGGAFPAWARNAHQLFYQTPAGRLMVVDYETHGDSFIPGAPRQWGAPRLLLSYTSFDVTADGKRIVGGISGERDSTGPGSVQVTFLLNFFDELKRRVP